VIERLAWVVSVFVIIWLANRWLRIYQTRGLRGGAHLATHGQASLIVVVSSRCAICPIQKKVVAKLRGRYPPSLLRVVTIDAEIQPAQARKLAVMTIPTTLVQRADGTMAHINNGFTQFDVLAKQIDNLLAPLEFQR
jgi:hypothetical protein